MSRTFLLGSVASILCSAGFAVHCAAQSTSQPGEWTSYGGDVRSTRYAPLDQINKDNFKDLKVAWTADSPDQFLTKSEGNGEWRASFRVIAQALLEETPALYRSADMPRTGPFKATPLMAEGKIFVSTPLYQAMAVDAATGKVLWVYDPKSYESGTPPSLTWNSRGCAYWTDGKDSRVVWGTGDGYLIAVDAKTGRPCADFGEKGRIDMTTGVPRAERGARDEQLRLMLCMSSPPLVMNDVIVCGSVTADTRQTKDTPAGWVQAYDARTGKKKWDFHTVALPGEFGADTWENGSNEYNGSANAWSMLSGDLELGYVYLPLTTPSQDYYGGHRHGDNLFAESLVCVKLETGERVWHFQAVHHGVWDYDFPSAPIVLDVNVDGKPRKIVAQLSKQAFCYVFDRVTGVPIWPIVEKPVITEPHLPGEKLSPTQPHPTKPLPVSGQGTTEDQVIDFTPELHSEAMQLLSHFRTGPLFTAPTLATLDGTWGTPQRPSLGGATTWPGACADPTLGYLFVPSRDTTGIVYYYQPKQNESKTNSDWTHGGRPPAGVGRLQGPQGLPMWKPPYSRMTAIDLNSGDNAWMKPSGKGSDRIRNHPALKGIDLPDLGGEGRGGPIVTKTLMISWRGGSVRGEGGEVEDPTQGGGPALIAYDKVTGAEVGYAALPSAPIGVPMTYMLNDKQYIALTCTGNPPKIVAMSLPDVTRAPITPAATPGGPPARGPRGGN